MYDACRHCSTLFWCGGVDETHKAKTSTINKSSENNMSDNKCCESVSNALRNKMCVMGTGGGDWGGRRPTRGAAEGRPSFVCSDVISIFSDS